MPERIHNVKTLTDDIMEMKYMSAPPDLSTVLTVVCVYGWGGGGPGVLGGWGGLHAVVLATNFHVLCSSVGLSFGQPCADGLHRCLLFTPPTLHTDVTNTSLCRL